MMKMMEAYTNARILRMTKKVACMNATKKTVAYRNATTPTRTKEVYRIAMNRMKMKKEVCTSVTKKTVACRFATIPMRTTEAYRIAKNRTMMKMAACTTVTIPMRTNAMRMKADYRNATGWSLIPPTNAIRPSNSSLRPTTIPQTMIRLRTTRASCRLGLAIRAPARVGPWRSIPPRAIWPTRERLYLESYFS